MRNLRQPIQAGDAAGETNRSEIRRLASRLPWRIRQRDGADGADIEFEFDGTAADADALGGVAAEDITALVTDGSAPASSPAPTVRGGPRYIAITWPGIANADPVTYEVHVSDTTGFTPDSTTLATSTRGTIAFVETLPETDAALAYGVDYFVKIVATDADGAAAASSQASAQLDPLGSDDILAGSVTAEKLAAVITLSSLFRTAASGGRLEWDSDGIRGYKSDGVTTWLEFNEDGTDALIEAIIRAKGVDLDAATAFPAVGREPIRWMDSGGDGDPAASMFGYAVGNQHRLYMGTADVDGVNLNGYFFILYDEVSDSSQLIAAAGPYSKNIFVSDKSSGFLQLGATGDDTEYCALERKSVSVNIPSTGAHSGGSINVSIPGLEIGDWVVCIGNNGAGDPRQFHAYTNSICTVADQITLQYFNADASTRDPAAFTFYFLILHLTVP